MEPEGHTVAANGSGGGIFQAGNTGQVLHVTLAFNTAQRSANGQPETGVSQGGGLCAEGGTLELANTIIAHSAGGRNCCGAILDNGGNLSTYDSCAFTESDSLTDIDPMLGLLADNGGPTPTHALERGSPAIDGSNRLVWLADQRGVRRPQGSAFDIGAFEATRLTIQPHYSGDWFLEHWGIPRGACTLQTSTDCEQWRDVATQQADDSGLVGYFVPPPDAGAVRFFRVRMP